MKTLDLNITSNCNYACEFCFGESDMGGDMGKEVFLKSLDLAKKLDVSHIEFCGGEPLLHQKFEEFVSIARRQGFSLILRTNGIYLNNHIDFIADHFEWVAISLDGAEEGNDLMRVSRNTISVKDKFNLPIDALFKLNELNPKIKLLVATVVSSINFSDVIKLGEYIYNNNLPIERWKINLFRAKERRALEFKNKYFLSESKFDELSKMPVFENIKKFKGIDIVFNKGSISNGECLIVTKNGEITLGPNKISNIISMDINSITSVIGASLNNITSNKGRTYN